METFIGPRLCPQGASVPKGKPARGVRAPVGTRVPSGPWWTHRFWGSSRVLGCCPGPQHLSQGPDCGSQRGGQSRVLCGSCQLQGSLTAPEDGRKLPVPTWKMASFCSFWLWFRLGVALAALLSACLGKQLDPQSGSSRPGPAWSSGDHLQGEMKTQHPGPQIGQSHVKGAEIESSFPLTAVYVLIDGVLNLLFNATLRKDK